MAYTGPGDVAAVGTNGVFYGLRAYNAAYATGSNNALQVTKDAGASSQDLVILNTGYIDVATAVSYAGGNPLKIITAYDQSGNGRNLTQTVDANRPVLVIPGSGAFPYISFDGSAEMHMPSDTTVNANTYSVSGLVRSTVTADGAVAAINGVNRQLLRVNFGSPGTALHYNGSTSLSFPFTNNAWHSTTISVDASDNGTAYIDGSPTGPLGVGGSSGTGAMVLGGLDAGPVTPFTGFMTEFTYWDTTALSSGQVATVAAQQIAYQGAFAGGGSGVFLPPYIQNWF